MTPGRHTSSRGFIYATTGEAYDILARRSARTLRAVMPDAQIDLFTSGDIDDPVFDQIHKLNHPGKFPKVEALGRSRFRTSILFDADIVPLADVSELFGSVRGAHLAMTMGISRPKHLHTWQRDIPLFRPVPNSGVIVFRNGRRVRQLSRAWMRAMTLVDPPADQVPLRRLIGDLGLRVTWLPPEYNLIFLPMLDVWEEPMGAPKILHVRELHWSDPGNPLEPFRVEDLVGADHAEMIRGQLVREAGYRANLSPQHWARRSRMGQKLIELWRRLTS